MKFPIPVDAKFEYYFVKAWNDDSEYMIATQHRDTLSEAEKDLNTVRDLYEYGVVIKQTVVETLIK